MGVKKEDTKDGYRPYFDYKEFFRKRESMKVNET